MRHHYWWHFYEMEVVRTLEQKMPWGQYPPEAPAGGRRSFVKGWRLFRLSATAATYGIYISSLLFFLTVGVISLVT